MDDSPVDMSEALYEPLTIQPALQPPPLPPPGMAVPYSYAYGYPIPVSQPRIWTGFTAFGVYLLLTVGFGIIIGLSIAASGGTFEFTLPMVLALMAASVGGAGLVAIVGAYFSPEPFLDRLQLRLCAMSTYSTLLGMVTSCAIGLTFTASFAMLAKLPGLSKILNAPNLLDGISSASPGMMALAYLIIAGGAGVGEELLFRGYMQSRFVKRMGFYGALFTAAGLFGLAHMNLMQTPFAFVLGLFVGHLAYRTGSILPAMLCHIANNAMAITLVSFNLNSQDLRINAILFIVSLIIVVVGWFAMTKITPTPAATS